MKCRLTEYNESYPRKDKRTPYRKSFSTFAVSRSANVREVFMENLVLHSPEIPCFFLGMSGLPDSSSIELVINRSLAKGFVTDNTDLALSSCFLSWSISLSLICKSCCNFSMISSYCCFRKNQESGVTGDSAIGTDEGVWFHCWGMAWGRVGDPRVSRLDNIGWFPGKIFGSGWCSARPELDLSAKGKFFRKDIAAH